MAQAENEEEAAYACGQDIHPQDPDVPGVHVVMGADLQALLDRVRQATFA